MGQKSGITRRWARRGRRSSTLREWRCALPLFLGAICPQEGKGEALLLHLCTTAAINLHLAESSGMVSPDKHAVRPLDQAGWHLWGEVRAPANITLPALPPECPELKVKENFRQFMRDNWLSNQARRDHDDNVDHCSAAWNRLIGKPLRLMSIGSREWVHGYWAAGSGIMRQTT